MGTQGDGEGAAASGPDGKKDDIYENRPGSKKIIRVVTVMAYMVSVSFVAIVLSAYYVFLWQPPNPRLMHRSHLRGDPQVDYLMDRPPTEVSLDENLDAIDMEKKVNVFREEILKNRGVKISKKIQPEVEINKVNQDNLMNLKDEREKKIMGTTWNPIVRALLATTTEIPESEESERGNSTGVYDKISTNVSSGTIEASTLFTREISKSIGRRSFTSGLMEDKYEKEAKFTAIPISIEDVGNRKLTGMLKNSTEKEIEESIRRSKDLVGSFKDKNVEIHEISKEETTLGMMTSGTRIFGVKAEMLRKTEKSVEKPEVVRVTEKSVEKPEVDRMTEKSAEKPEMLRATEKSAQKPEVGRIAEKSAEKPEMLRMTEKSVEKPEMLRMTKKSAEKPEVDRIAEKLSEKPEMVQTTEKSVEKPEMLPITKKSVAKPEMLPITEKPEMLPITEKSAKKPEMIRTTENSVNKPEMLRTTENSVNKPEMLRTTEKSAEKPEMLQTTEKSAEKPEMLQTTEKSAEQQEDRKLLEITIQPIELASHTTRGSAKFPTNETENLENFSSPQQINDEVSIEIVPDSPGDEDPLIKSSISMVPAIIQPESEYMEQEQQSKEQSTQDSDFGFV